MPFDSFQEYIFFIYLLSNHSHRVFGGNFRLFYLQPLLFLLVLVNKIHKILITFLGTEKETTARKIISMYYLYTTKRICNISLLPDSRPLYKWLSSSCNAFIPQRMILGLEIVWLKYCSITWRLSDFHKWSAVHWKHDITELRLSKPLEKAHLISQTSEKEGMWELQVDFGKLLQSELQTLLECGLIVIHFLIQRKSDIIPRHILVSHC